MKARIIAAGFALATVSTAAAAKAPHLELDLTSAEYRALNAQRGLKEADSGALQKVLDTGKRVLDWIDAVNAQRADGQKLELSTPATQTGIPITTPKYYNKEIVQQEFDDAIAGLPKSVADILTGTDAVPTTIPVDDDTFLVTIRKVDRAYQDASRWLLMVPYLDELAEYSQQDVRGYYYLTREDHLVTELSGYSSLPDDVRARLEPLLATLCHNSGDSIDTCKDELNTAAKDGTVLEYYNDYFPAAKELWDSFFQIARDRPDVDWTSQDPNVMRVPFQTPSIPAVKDWLQTNIEDEWRLGPWQLRLAFQDAGGDDVPHVEFEAGTTPHVNDVAGNIITMDANRSIQEYTARWTIRHEYGHVLGFPDCYVEYYDTDKAAMINYQLDITNLMCARTGHLQQLHVDELRKAYFDQQATEQQ